MSRDFGRSQDVDIGKFPDQPSKSTLQKNIQGEDSLILPGSENDQTVAQDPETKPAKTQSLDDHKNASELDHPSGSVKIKHLATQIRALLEALVQGDSKAVLSEDLDIEGILTVLQNIILTGNLIGSSSTLINALRLALGTTGDIRDANPGTGIELAGSTSSGLIVVQDGNGRLIIKWNATYGTTEKFIVGGEDALKFVLSVGTHTVRIYFGSGSGVSAGDAVPWTEIFRLGSNGDVTTFARTTVPVGTVYIQFPGKDGPGDIFTGTWSDISSSFAGRFFRAAGGDAAAFGAAQGHALQGHGHATQKQDSALSSGSSRVRPYGGGVNEPSPYVINPISLGGYGTVQLSTETRPTNYTIRIWERIN